MENMKKQELSEKESITISIKEIPIDLFILILSRLPVKSIARCRCVSKQWAWILRRRDFTDMYLKMSSSRPCLLFTSELNGKWLFLSAPQPLNPDQNSSPLAADYHMSFPISEACFFGNSSPVSGLLCSNNKNSIMCNPSTGQYLTLPKVTSKEFRVSTYLGYDPIDKVFKVLCMSMYPRVLTLGTGDMSWRMIECSIPHCPIPNGICINGVLYYLAATIGNRIPKPFMLVCFDVRSEKFKFLVQDDSIWMSTLINCNGKLGAVLPDSIAFFSRRATKLELWVLDDAENHIWSKHIYQFPPLWKNLVGDSLLCITGMTCNGEIVFSPNYLDDPFYIFYYNVVRNTVVRVQIQFGIAAPEYHKVYTFMNHVEDVKLMKM